MALGWAARGIFGYRSRASEPALTHSVLAIHAWGYQILFLEAQPVGPVGTRGAPRRPEPEARCYMPSPPDRPTCHSTGRANTEGASPRTTDSGATGAALSTSPANTSA
jgi:hypothetical protein